MSASWSLRAIGIWLVLCVSVMAPRSTGAEALSYSDSAPGPRGTRVPITFAGDFADAEITGVLAYGDLMVSVEGKAASAGISGTFRWDGGSSAGTFVGRIEDDSLVGTYAIDGASGRWSLPLSRIPTTVRKALQ